MKQINTIPVKNVSIFMKDANMLVKNISVDVVAIIDPQYNSRQYSRFYHVLEPLIRCDKPNFPESS
jgi:adenine-specific DNA-methyltransferase